MGAKALLIPLAAFALSATGVSAFNSEVLQKAGLSEVQISAFEKAHELRKEGDRGAAREVLQNAGIDITTMESVREAMHEYKESMQSAIDRAVDHNDYDAFRTAVEGSPLSDLVTTKEDFNLFVEARKLKEEGEYKAAREIMEDLGFERGFSGHLLGHPIRHDEGLTGRG